MDLFITKDYIMGKFVITEQERRHIMGLYEQVTTGSTVPQSGTTKTISNRNPNRPTCDGKGLISLGCWLDEIDKVQREIGNPKTWTMDSYNRLQKTLNDYKTWRTTTPEGKAVQDSHNAEGEYIVQLPDHLKTVKESRYRMGLYESVIVKSPNEDEWCKKNITDKTNQVCVVKTPDTGDKEICRKMTGDFVKSKGYVNNIKIESEGNFCRTIWEKIK